MSIEGDRDQPGLHYQFTAELYHMNRPTGAAYYMCGVPDEAAAEIRDLVPAHEAPWGMISVFVGLDNERWKTILFPRKGSTGYDISFNARLRKRLHLEVGDSLNLELFVPLGFVAPGDSPTDPDHQ